MKRYLLFLASIIIGAYSFYQYQIKVYEDERDFVLYGLIREGAIYTLLGDKPISDFGVYIKNDQNTGGMSTEIVDNPIEFDRSKLTCSENNHFTKDPYKLWKNWKKRQPLTGKKYGLVCISTEEFDSLYFVNKQLTKITLEKNYSLLSKSIQKEFDIDVVINEIDDPKSFFWTHIINCEYGHICMGLLFGFGLENTLEFQKDRAVNDFDTWGGYLCEEPIVDFYNRHYSTVVSLENLPIPRYVSFSDPDPVAEHYKKERTRIQEQYKDADLRQLLIDALKQ